MNWKSTAVVSGATLLAGWLASAPPAPTAPAALPPSSKSPQTATTASDIGQLAAHLQLRTRRDADYGAPERNLFRFGPNVSKSAAPHPAPSPAAIPPVEILPQAPPPPIVSLSGMASDADGERVVRTAILSSPAGVLLVHEGDEVLGQYRVGAIGENSVELIRLSDGVALRLALRP
jgi:hypothetical protein